MMRALDMHVCRVFHDSAQWPDMKMPLDTTQLFINDMHSAALQWQNMLPRIRPTIPVLLMTGNTAHELTTLTAALELASSVGQRIDYLLTPIKPHALLARVQVLQQRAWPGTLQTHQQFSNYIFDIVESKVSHAGKLIITTKKEFALALLLFSNIGHPLSRNYLKETLWNHDDTFGSRTIDTHMSRIRHKLHLEPENGFSLTTIYGYGYLLEQIRGETPKKPMK